MKWITALFFLLFTLVVADAQPSLDSVARTTISGTQYIRIKDWSDAAGLTVRWTKKDEELLLTNRFCRINFTVRSILARFNGMDVRLSLPIVSKNGGVYISTTDVYQTVHPLLFPARNTPTEKINVVCIDAGHGGHDKGKIDKQNYEKKYTLLLAEEMGKLLKENGIKVVYTRTKDTYIELPDRASAANRQQADLFLSVHFNAANSREVRGAEIYSMTPAGVESSNAGPGRSLIGNHTGNKNNAKNVLLAFAIQRSILRATGFADRGMKRARFEVLRDAKMPAVLIEAGFMTSPEDAKKIYDPNFRKRLAKSVVDGVLAYKKIVDGVGAVGITAAN